MEIGRASTATPSEASSLYHNIPLTVLEFFATSPIGSPIEYGSYLSGYTYTHTYIHTYTYM